MEFDTFSFELDGMPLGTAHPWLRLQLLALALSSSIVVFSPRSTLPYRFSMAATPGCVLPKT